MCFSPRASFGASALLSLLGITALKRTGGSRQAFIAAIPLFFGMQQALEGFVWLAVLRGDTTSLWYSVPVYGFLFFAAVWWPLYIPAVLWYLEQQPQRKRWLLLPLGTGILVAIVALINLYISPNEVVIVGHHLSYQQSIVMPWSSALYIFGLGCYLVAIAGALFISSIRYAWIMGVLVIAAFATAWLWYYLAFGSVWCFFAAISSALILIAV